MKHFPLNRLPYSLRTSIFTYSSSRERLKFCEINKELRHYVLNNGPLPKRLGILEICGPGNSFEDQLYDWGEEKLFFWSKTSSYHELCLEIDEHRRFPRKGEEMSIRIPLKDLSTFLAPRPSCRNLTFVCATGNISNATTRLLDLVPNFACLDQLSIEALDFGVVPEILKRIRTKAITTFSLQLDAQEERPDSWALGEFFSENLKECEEIGLYGARIEVTDSGYAALQMTSIKRLDISLRNADFRDFLEMVFTRGLPSQNPNFCLKLRSYQANPEILWELGRRLPEWAERIEDSEVKEWVSRKLDMKPTDFKIGLCFKRRISDKLEHYYFLGMRSNRLCLYALSHPIP